MVSQEIPLDRQAIQVLNPLMSKAVRQNISLIVHTFLNNYFSVRKTAKTCKEKFNADHKVEFYLGILSTLS